MKYQKTFEIGKKDNERFNLFSMKRKTFRMSSMVFLMITFMVILTRLTKGSQMFYAVLIGVLYGIAGILFFLIVNYLLVKGRLYLFYKRGSIKPFKQQIEMNETGIYAKTENGSVHVTFDKIACVRETKHAFYIMITTELVYVFPKNQMIDEEFKEVRDLFKAGISMDRLKLFA